MLLQYFWQAQCKRREAQLWPVDHVDKRHESLQINGAVECEQLLLSEIKAVSEEISQLGRTLGADLEFRRSSKAPAT